MGLSEVRQLARREAAEKAARLRHERAVLEKRRDDLAAAVLTKVAERDAFVAQTDRDAGDALTQLISTGLTRAEAVTRCDLTEREASRLLRVASGTS